MPSSVNFTSVSTYSASISWTLDTPGTETPLMVLSTDPSFSVTLSSAILTLGQGTTVYYGLLSNATYYFQVKVSTESDAGYSAAVSSATPPVAPQSFALAEVNVASFTAQWSAGNNGPGTVYWAEASLDDSFSINAISSGTAALALYEGLNPNSTYFLRSELGSVAIAPMALL